MDHIKLEHWEDDEYIITLHGAPVGRTLSKREGSNVLEWLKTSFDSISDRYESIRYFMETYHPDVFDSFEEWAKTKDRL